MSVLRVRDLHVEFGSEEGTVHAVRGVSYDVEPGEVLAVVGESGSGKSVSSLAVMGLLPETARIRGSITLGDRELLGLSDKEMSRLRGRSVSMISQDPLTALTPIFRIGDQIAEAIEVHNKGLSRKAIDARVQELLTSVGIRDAAARARAYPHEFSGGMRQRVMIAMAIANEPDLIIADEPTTALDVTIQAQILSLLRQAQRETGAAMVFITHDLGVVAGIADRAMVMYAGKAVETATATELFAHPSMPYTVGLLGAVPRLDTPAQSRLIPIEGSPPSLVTLPSGCTFAPRCPVAIEACLQGEPPLEEVAPDHRAACVNTAAARRPAEIVYDVDVEPETAVEPVDGDVVLAVQDLRKSYTTYRGSVFRRAVGAFQAVDGVSFTLRQGKTLAIVGESGCGKSTTLRAIMDFTRPESGTISVCGQQPYDLDAAGQRRLRSKIQMVFQDPMASLDPRLPVAEIIGEPLRIHGVDGSQRSQRVAELLDQVGLSSTVGERFPTQFSGGQRQRIAIARALALKPDILVLDEPVSALDVSIQAGVLNLLADLQDELGLAYLFVSHDLSVVAHLADDVAVMSDGRFVETGPAQQVFTDPQHEYTRALLEAVPVPDPEISRRRFDRGDTEVVESGFSRTA